MQKQENIAEALSESFKTALSRFLIAVIFSIALGYFEAAVVVYLREIFYPKGFTFPLEIFSIDPLSKRLFLTEIGREAASLVLIFTGAWLFGSNRRQRIAYFLIIFAVWDIFYYIWLKVLLDWPVSIMDWDILFLIPMTWAGPVLAPVLCSAVMFLFAMAILYRDFQGRGVYISILDGLVFVIAGFIVIISFCIPGPHTLEADYNSYFYWSLFSAGLLPAVGTFVKCLVRSKSLCK
ncbi:MAG: hypothetical protein JW787_12185 [Sedimentisphaerales bacterium]|nr:hypothetical protein [Sedimentisphaerales bacterium]